MSDSLREELKLIAVERIGATANILKHLFAAEKCDELIGQLRRLAGENIGVAIPLAKETLNLDGFTQTRLGMCR